MTTTRERRDATLIWIADAGRRSFDEIDEAGMRISALELMNQAFVRYDSPDHLGLVLTDMGLGRVDMIQNPY